MTDFFETPSDTGVTQSDDFSRAISTTISDTLTQSEIVELVIARTQSDTGITQSDTPSLQLSRFRDATDTVITFSDYIGSFSRRTISDTLTFSDTLVKNTVRVISSTGTTTTSQFVVKSFRFFTSTGSTVSESLGALVVPAPSPAFTMLCKRNWVLADDTRKWTPNAYARFTYVTIGD